MDFVESLNLLEKLRSSSNSSSSGLEKMTKPAIEAFLPLLDAHGGPFEPCPPAVYLFWYSFGMPFDK